MRSQLIKSLSCMAVFQSNMAYKIVKHQPYNMPIEIVHSQEYFVMDGDYYEEFDNPVIEEVITIEHYIVEDDQPLTTELFDSEIEIEFEEEIYEEADDDIDEDQIIESEEFIQVEVEEEDWITESMEDLKTKIFEDIRSTLIQYEAEAEVEEQEETLEFEYTQISNEPENDDFDEMMETIIEYEEELFETPVFEDIEIELDATVLNHIIDTIADEIMMELAEEMYLFEEEL